MPEVTGELVAVVCIALAQVAAVGVAISFVAGAFSVEQSCPDAAFEDDGLLLAQITAVLLTTPWNVDRKLSRIFNQVISVALFFTFATSIIIAENSIESLRACGSAAGGGKKGAYYSIVFINLLIFVHTSVLWGIKIAT